MAKYGKPKLNRVPKTGRRAPIRVEAEDVGVSGDSEFVRKAINLYQMDSQADEHNMSPAREDIRFVIGDQWDAMTRAQRERNNKPVLTVNRLPAFVAQYVGSWLQSDTTIKLSPTRGGTKRIAEIRQGIIRAIMRNGVGKHALDQAMTHSYICGIGNFSVGLIENEHDVFDKDIVLKAHEDPFEVVWDRASREPTGKDANHAFVFEYMTKDDFKDTYPDAIADAGWPMDEITSTSAVSHGWEIDDMVRVAHFWQIRHEPMTVALEAETGDVIDITDMEEDEWRAIVALDDRTQEPIVRETTRPYAECYVMTKSQILEEPCRFNISRLPVFRVPGWVMYEGTVQHRWGFVRNAKDPQRLHNYWRSILAEELAKSVSSKWLLDQTAMKSGLADRFRNAHLSNDNVLFWDSQSDGGRPEFIPPPQINQAVMTEAHMSVQDIKDVTNKHEASFGMVSNEVSGKAISARQRVSELGDIIYIEHMNAAMAEAGRVINEMIPEVYDTQRTVKVVGPDDQEDIEVINDDFNDDTPDITKGKYDVTYSTGPSYATKRQEAVDITMTLMNTMPQVGNLVADILVRNMDIPGAEEIEDRLAAMLPEGMIDLDRLPPKRRQKVEMRQQAQQQAQQMAQQQEQAMFVTGLEKVKAEILELAARAEKQGAQADAERARTGIEAIEAMIDAQKNKIDAAKVGVDIGKLNRDVILRGLEAAQEDSREERAAAQQGQGQPQQPGQQSSQPAPQGAQPSPGASAPAPTAEDQEI